MPLLPVLALSVAGVIGTILQVRWARSRRGGGRWIHILWIVVAVFVTLMTMIILALRNGN